MVRPAQKLTTVAVSSVDVGDTISYDLPQVRGLFKTHKGTVHRILFEGRSRVLVTQEGEPIVTWKHGSPEPRVFMLERAPEPQSLLELFT